MESEKEVIKKIVKGMISDDYHVTDEMDDIIDCIINDTPRILVWHGEVRIGIEVFATDFSNIETLIADERKYGRTRFKLVRDPKKGCYFLSSKQGLEYDYEYAERISQMVKNTIAKSNTRSIREKALAYKVKTLREELERAEEEFLKYQNAL